MSDTQKSNPESFSENLAQVKIEVARVLATSINSQNIAVLKAECLGKNGFIKELFNSLRTVPDTERSHFAQAVNELRYQVEHFFEEEEARLEAGKLAIEIQSKSIDFTLPERTPGYGAIHPISAVEGKIRDLMSQCGFKIVYGPEIESEYFCFDSLNIPADHPARDMQDTFYTSNNRVLRTHTTSVQARQLKEAVNLLKDGALREGASIKIASIGKAYRNEAEDATHQSMFHQFELVWVDVGLTLADLMGLIEFIVKELFGRRRKIRFIPKFYPYTEPSIGVAVSHRSDDTWQTVAGAGMIHRKVLDEFGFTSPKITGLAFGFGMERLAMQYYGYSDIRSLYENDLRRLRSNR